jgi:hypothetical protein
MSINEAGTFARLIVPTPERREATLPQDFFNPVLPGTKLDKGKPDFSLLPWDSIEEVVKVLDFGAKKYSKDNWRKVKFAKCRYFAAAVRHIITEWWVHGRTKDEESGYHPLAHAICCLLFLMEFDKGGYPDDN